MSLEDSLPVTPLDHRGVSPMYLNRVLFGRAATGSSSGTRHMCVGPCARRVSAGNAGVLVRGPIEDPRRGGSDAHRRWSLVTTRALSDVVTACMPRACAGWRRIRTDARWVLSPLRERAGVIRKADNRPSDGVGGGAWEESGPGRDGRRRDGRARCSPNVRASTNCRGPCLVART